MRRTATASLWFPVSVGKVFATMTEPENYRKIPGVSSVRIIRNGENGRSNGSGAIREISLMGGKFREEILSCEENRQMDYRFIDWPLPLHHVAGSMIFSEEIHRGKSGTLVTWVSTIEARRRPLSLAIPALAFSTSAGLKGVLFRFRQIAKQR